MTPYAQMLAANIRPEAQATYAYEYHRYAKDPTVAFLLTLVLGIVGGESYYLGDYKRGILMSLAFMTGIGVLITIPMWICRCFTIQNECETYDDYIAYSLALRYWNAGTEMRDDTPQPPPTAPQPPTNARVRPTISNVPMMVRSI
jgi:hypothetical protein